VNKKFVFILAGVALSALLLFPILGFLSKKSIPTLMSTTLKQEPRHDLPARLIIPKISVDAAVESLGLTGDGAMDVPKGPLNVGWFELGPRPGETGSAVIDGHLNGKTGKIAVFDKLSALVKGDLVNVVDEKGQSLSFVVSGTKSYNADAVVPEVFTSADGVHLNLITCEGVWDKAKKSYTQRLVVFADLKK
jgi:sortase A